MLTAAAVVLALDGSVPAALVPGLALPGGLPEGGRIAPARRTTCTYFCRQRPQSPAGATNSCASTPTPRAYAHNIAFPADVAPAYAPPGRSLISVSTHGDHGLGDSELAAQIRAELAPWFGGAVHGWEHLRTYNIANALPEYAGGQPGAVAVAVGRRAVPLRRLGGVSVAERGAGYRAAGGRNYLNHGFLRIFRINRILGTIFRGGLGGRAGCC